MNLQRILELSEEEQKVLDSIKIELQEIKDGEKGITTEDMRRLLNI